MERDRFNIHTFIDSKPNLGNFEKCLFGYANDMAGSINWGETWGKTFDEKCKFDDNNVYCLNLGLLA